MHLAQYVKKKGTLGSLKNLPADPFQVAFGIDGNFFPPMGIMLTSMAMNNPDLAVRAHVFFNDALPEDLDKLRKFAEMHPRFVVDLYQVDVSAFRNFKVSKTYTVATYHRILIAEVLFPEVQKVLYMDADTLCVGDISEILDIPFDGSPCMSVPDRGTWLDGHKKELGIPVSDPYFNAGVMYIDLAKWNELGMSARMVELLDGKKLSFQDQDALNLLARNDIKALPVRYNQFFLMKEKGNEIPPGTVILHFAGELKPWQPWCDNPDRGVYDRYREKSLWKSFEYRPRNYQEQRLMGKVARRQGHLRRAAKFYARYVVEKWRFLRGN